MMWTLTIGAAWLTGVCLILAALILATAGT